MTEKEAIKILQGAIKKPNAKDRYLGQAVTMGIQALEENQKYHAIGTVEEFKALKEKAVSKKPNYEGDGYYNGELVLDTWICPNCGKSYEVDYDNYDYCPNCGQNIDHSGLTEDD